MSFLEMAKRKAREIEFERGKAKAVPEVTLDDYWVKEIMPRLSRLYLEERLPALHGCPLWCEVDRLWKEPKPDTLRVKQAMKTALKACEEHRK